MVEPVNLLPIPPDMPAYTLDDDELAAQFWRSRWGAECRAKCQPDAPRRNRDPRVHTLICKFLDAPASAGGLHSIYALDDFDAIRAMRAAIMRAWPAEVTTSGP
jgi:hypothetical protein